MLFVFPTKLPADPPTTPPLLVQLPETLAVVPVTYMPPFKTTLTTLTVAGAVKTPLVIVNVPFNVNVVKLPAVESVWLDLLTVMLLNVCVPAVPVIVCE